MEKVLGSKIDLELIKEEDVNEIHGRGQAHVLNKVKGKDKDKLKKFLKMKKIRFGEDNKGNITIGDDDFDDVEEFMVRKLGIF